MIGVEQIEQNANEQHATGKLIQAIRQFVLGHKEAFEFVYHSTAPQLMQICRRYASNHDEAQDILQESYIKIYKSLKNFDLKAPFEPWAKRITINTAIDHYRKNLNLTFRSLGNLDQIEDEEEIFVSNDFLKLDIEKVMAAVQELPVGYRIILNLFVLEHKSHKEIAETLQINESTSRSQLTKARKAIKAKFENESR